MLPLAFLILSTLFTITNAAIAITGATGGVHPRLEIRQLANNKDQWNLYLLALRKFQNVKQDQPLSWYQIGGIHGSPKVAWDGVGNANTAFDVGYCTHSMNLFPCWHRPYIALFEQRLQRAAKGVAKKFKDQAKRKRYLELAATLRAPYWDWAAQAPNGGPTFPLVVSQQYVTVDSPKGAQTIVNPLFQYSFKPVRDDQVRPYGGPWNYWPTTLRFPTDPQASNAVSRNDMSQQTLDANRGSQRQSLYNWFTGCSYYDQISNDASGSSVPDCHNSLESLHNNIHVWVGGGNNGHMTVVPVSGWDPVFMLHHTMIDRLFAMWQGIYPDSYCTDKVSQSSSFTIQKGSVQGPNSRKCSNGPTDAALTPFHRNTNGDFWTCASVRNWRVFGYTYPEFSNSDGSANAIRGYVNRLYGPDASAPAGSSKRGIDAADVPAQALAAANGSTYQYIANIQTTRFKLDGSYLVYVFFGAPQTEDPVSWGTDAHMVGSYGVFSKPGMTDSDIVTTSTVPLTDALAAGVAAGGLASLAPAAAVPFLTANLDWRVATTLGAAVAPEAVPDFLISVVAATRTVPADPGAFPAWSDFSVLANITRGKPGGLAGLSQLGALGGLGRVLAD